jgi:hypothetical protein
VLRRFTIYHNVLLSSHGRHGAVYGGNHFMSQPAFFEAERKRFFRPLNNSRRERVVACLRAL